MEITDLEVVTLQVELDKPLTVSRNRTFESRSAVLIVVETDAGIRGIGESVGPDPAVVDSLVQETYAPRLIGEDPTDRERLWRGLLMSDLYWDQKGPGVAVASGIDMALWDIAGKQHDVPVYELLGGDVSGDNRVKAYASDLFWDDVEVMANAAEEYVDEGFTAVKTHLGGGIEADRERVAALTDAIGDAELMVDMNCAYEYSEALRVGQMLEEHDVYWYEEPLSPYDIDGLAELRSNLDVPIATGENEYTKWGFKDLFVGSAVDYAMPDIMRCGGITEMQKICGIAEAFEITVSPHCFASGVGLAATLHVIASTPACEWLEFDVTGYPLYESLLASPLSVDGTQVEVPVDPGLGVELTDDLVATYGIEDDN